MGREEPVRQEVDGHRALELPRRRGRHAGARLAPREARRPHGARARGPAGVSGPLAGVRVLDLSRVLAGPYCTMMLADLGAEVVKVERPGEGDQSRAWGPPFVGGESTYFMSVNRGKRSVAVDLRDPRGQEVVQRLAVRADVVVENFLPGGADRLGLGRDALVAERPALVYTSIRGYPLDSPEADQPGFDFAIQGAGGIMSITGEADGDPVKVGVAIADITTGMLAASGTLAALYEARATGRGRHVAISLLDAQLAWLGQPRLGGAGGRRGAGALRQRASLDLPLRDLPGPGRVRQPRRGHRRAVPALLRPGGPGRRRRRPALRHQPRPGGAPRGARAAAAGGVRGAHGGRLAGRPGRRRHPLRPRAHDPAGAGGRAVRARRARAPDGRDDAHDPLAAGPRRHLPHRHGPSAAAGRAHPGGAGGARLRAGGGGGAAGRSLRAGASAVTTSRRRRPAARAVRRRDDRGRAGRRPRGRGPPPRRRGAGGVARGRAALGAARAPGAAAHAARRRPLGPARDRRRRRARRLRRLQGPARAGSRGRDRLRRRARRAGARAGHGGRLRAGRVGVPPARRAPGAGHHRARQRALAGRGAGRGPAPRRRHGRCPARGARGVGGRPAGLPRPEAEALAHPGPLGRHDGVVDGVAEGAVVEQHVPAQDALLDRSQPRDRPPRGLVGGARLQRHAPRAELVEGVAEQQQLHLRVGHGALVGPRDPRPADLQALVPRGDVAEAGGADGAAVGVPHEREGQLAAGVARVGRPPVARRRSRPARTAPPASSGRRPARSTAARSSRWARSRGSSRTCGPASVTGAGSRTAAHAS